MPLVANGFGKPDLPSVWPAPGRIRFSGFCLVRVSGSRRWLHLRFPALLVSPVSNLICSSGFRCWLLLRFSSCPSLRFSAYLLLRFPVLSASPVFIFPPLRFSALLAPAVPGFVRLFALTRSSVSSPSALRQLFVSSSSALRQLSVSSPSAFRHTAGGAAAQSRKPSFTNCSRMRVQSATGRFTPSTNRIGQPRLLSSM